jgi:hypothetical protein
MGSSFGMADKKSPAMRGFFLFNAWPVAALVQLASDSAASNIS